MMGAGGTVSDRAQAAFKQGAWRRESVAQYALVEAGA
jgi:hypothetical protein